MSRNGESFVPDTGCDLHPSCLACPRAICIFDEPRSRAPSQRTALMRVRVTNLKARGLSVADIAHELNVTSRTVQRYLEVLTE